MTNRIPLGAAALASALFAGAATAQSMPKPFDFTIANIMRGPEVYGREPSNIRWTADGQWIYFSWLEPGADWRQPATQFRVKADAGAKPERVPPGDAAVFADPGRLSPDGRSRLTTTAQGAIVLTDVATGARRVLSQTTETKTNPLFSADGRKVFYSSGNNVYEIALDSASIRQLTDIRVPVSDQGAAAQQQTGAAAVGGRGGNGVGGGRGAGAGAGGRGGRGGGAGAAAGTANDTSASAEQKAALVRQQLELFQVLRDKNFQDSAQRAETRGGGGGGRGAGAGRGGRGGGAGATDASAASAVIGPRVFSVPTGDRLGAVSMSPSGSALLIATQGAGGGAATSTIVPSWVTASGYVEEINGRSKVGDASPPSGKLTFMSAKTGETHTLHLTGTTDVPASVNVIGWNDSGSEGLVMAASGDFKNRWIYTVSSDSGKLNLVEAEHDSAWIGGPCGRCMGWYDGGKRLYYVSEADGYAHLYTTAADGSDKKQFTKGKWEVVGVQLSNDKKWFYLTSSEESVFEQHFYRMPVSGGAREKITSGKGGHTVTLSPDQTKIADVFSSATNRPPELYVADNKVGATESQITTSPTAAWLAFPWIVPEIVMIPGSDGVMVPAHIFRPKDVHASANGAAVIFVHGAGYLHNVMNYWPSSYPREFMFNQYLASKGYVVLDIDYRGSAGYGRDWRTAIYRWMGGRDLQDQVDGVKYLQKNFGVNPKRVGIYGGSYGGFMTLMALFTQGQWFGAGAALRSVTDWAHYNHGYTAPILNLPENDTLAYRRSSPIFFAQGLDDPLIMFHGMVDTNVEFEDIVRLTQRLIELGKKNWQLAPYPVEDHSFVRPDSWTDEYSRIFDLFESTIRKGATKLPVPGGD